MNAIELLVNGSRPLVLDGGLASELERQGHQLHELVWSAMLLHSESDSIRDVHTSYLQAGADVITTASYQATLEGFARSGFSRIEGERLLVRAVQLAKNARDSFCHTSLDATRMRPLVAASIGPYGAYLANGAEYTGRYDLSSVDDLKRFHLERWEILSEQSPDLMLCETIPSFNEAQALAALASSIPIPTIISFSCRDASRISDGTSIRDCARWLDDYSSIILLGVNCVAPDLVLPVLDELRAGTDKPLVAYPNSGEVYDATAGEWSGPSRNLDYSHLADDWIAAGARLVGGCCRTTPADIAHLRKSMTR